MPPKGRGRPAKNTGQATSILGDLQALSSDDLENLKDVKVSFTCKKCGARSPTLKSLIEHLSTECKIGLLKNAAPAEVKLNADGTPKRGRGRPRKSETAVAGTGDEEQPPGESPTKDEPPGESPEQEEEDASPIILPESTGRVTRISSGTLKRKSTAEILNDNVEDDDVGEGEDDEEIYDAHHDDDDDYFTVPRSGRGRGRPRKYQAVETDFENIEAIMYADGEADASTLEGEEVSEQTGDVTESKPHPRSLLSPRLSLRSVTGPMRRPRIHRSFKCEICKLRFFSTLDELTVHSEAHIGDAGDTEKYQCKVCQYEATVWSRMLFHLVTHDEFKEKLKNTETVRNVYGRFRCPYPRCLKVFDKKLNMNTHWRKVHHKVNRTCDLCQATLEAVDEKTFIRHVEKCKNVTHRCDMCDYKTPVTSNLKRHMKIHTGEGFPCSYCEAVFPTKQRKTIHEAIHSKNRPRYVCDLCSHTFCSEDAVKKHIARMHMENAREWTCGKCNYVAKLEIDLRKHDQIVHNKKFKCAECEYMTNTERNFAQHREYHEPDRIYPCPVQVPPCYFRANTTGKLASHVAQVHNVRSKHQCPICLKFFKKKTHLLRHLVTHTEERPYQCRDCGESFYSHSTYYRHRHKTGHDAKREGIVSVPQNITIQYLEEVPDEERAQLQGAVEGVPAQEIEQLLSGAEQLDPAGLPAQVLVQQAHADDEAAAQAIIMEGIEEAGTVLDETVVTEGVDMTEHLSADMHCVLSGEHQPEQIVEVSAGQEQETITYVLKMEGVDGQTHEVTLDPGTDLAESIANLQTEGHQIVYEEAAVEAPVAPETSQVQTVVQVEPTSSGSGAPQFAIVVWPEGDEPEAALSMLQLQQGNQTQ